jgi:hypothetical protein
MNKEKANVVIALYSSRTCGPDRSEKSHASKRGLKRIAGDAAQKEEK